MSDPIIHAIPAISQWQDLTISAGWKAASHAARPRCCTLGDLVIVTGALIRQVGGYVSNLATLPPPARPSTTQYLGAGVTNTTPTQKPAAYEIYTNQSGRLSIEWHNQVSSGTGQVLPISVVYRKI